MHWTKEVLMYWIKKVLMHWAYLPGKSVCPWARGRSRLHLILPADQGVHTQKIHSIHLVSIFFFIISLVPVHVLIKYGRYTYDLMLSNRKKIFFLTFCKAGQCYISIYYKKNKSILFINTEIEWNIYKKNWKLNYTIQVYISVVILI